MYLFLCIVSFISVFPLYWMVSAATNKSADVISGRLIPGGYFIENLNNLLAAQNIGRAFGNSFKYAAILTIVSLLVSSLAGYGFEIFHDKAKDTLMSIILLAMMVPFVATMIPLFQMFSKAGWLNTTIGFILPTISTPFLIMMFRQSARSFPHDIMEAARIDGAGELHIFHKIVLPIMAPGIATMSICAFIGNWNNYLVPLILLNTPDKMTLPVMISTLNAATDLQKNQGAIYLGVAISVVPIMIVFCFCSKYIISSITAGSVNE